MKRFYRGSIARFVALNVIAICALLLQAFSPVAGSLVASNSVAGVICSDTGSRSGLPLGEHHHSGLCCVLACATHSFTYIATAFDIAAYASPDVSAAHWFLRNSFAPSASFKLSFSARGPPPAA